MAIKSPEHYEKEILRLKAELSRLKQKSLINLTAGPNIFGSSQKSFTIVGLEEMVILVDGDGSIRFANTSFANLLGAKDKKDFLKAPLSDWDKYPLGEGFLNSLVQTVKSTGRVFVLEHEFQDFPGQLLAEKNETGASVMLRFVCHPVDNQVQIVIQNVTSMRWLEKTFSRYVSPKVIELLRKVPASDLLKVERITLTVLFTDLRGFTRVSQEIEPEEVCEMVNSHFAAMVEGIEKYDGTVDKFVGDGVMAVFGAPLHQKDHALRALLAAVEMVKSHQAWQEDRRQQNKAAPAVGIGIVTGEVIVGNIGTEQQMDYTVLGQPVNLAARLCGAASGLEILTVKETHQAALKAIKQGAEFKNIPHLKFEPKGSMELKNVKGPVEVIRVVSALEKQKE